MSWQAVRLVLVNASSEERWVILKNVVFSCVRKEPAIELFAYPYGEVAVFPSRDEAEKVIARFHLNGDSSCTPS